MNPWDWATWLSIGILTVGSPLIFFWFLKHLVKEVRHWRKDPRERRAETSAERLP